MVETHPEYWAFHRALREHPGDTTVAGMLADWLEEHGDWRAELFRHPAGHDFAVEQWTHHTGRPATLQPGAWQASVFHNPDRSAYRGFTNVFGGKWDNGEPVYPTVTFLPHPHADALRYAALLERHHLDRMIEMAPDERVRNELIRARDHADEERAAGRPIEPTKLARSLVGRVWDKLTGGTATAPAWNHHYDGIVHTGGGLNGYGKAFAERSAVARALQHIGGHSVGSDAATIRRYTELAHRFVKQFPDHPLTKYYVEKAAQINDPTAIGENGRYATVPTTGPVGGELATAATPLVRFLNRIEAAQGRDTIRVPQLPDRRTVSETPAEPPEGVPAEWPLEIRKAADEGSRIPLASLRQRKKEAEVPAVPYQDTEPPIPLANYPGEIGPTGDRWGDLDVMHGKGADKLTLLKHLMDRYALNPRNAAETLRRWAARRGVDRTKLARPRPPAVPSPTPKQVRTVAPTDKDWLAGTQLAYHLRSLVNEGLTNRDGELVHAARRALGYRGMGDDPARYPNGDMKSESPLANAGGVGRLPVPADRGKYVDAYPRPTSDPYADLGTLLKARGHRLASAYNWHTLERSMMRDRAVETALRKLIVGAGQMDDHELFRGVARQFGIGQTVVPRDPKDAKFAAFWTRLKKLVDASPHTLGPSTLGQLNDSIKRLADREEFRREVGEEHTGGSGAHTWQQIFGMLPGSKYMKFQRPAETR